MAQHRFREETINVELARALAARGLVASAETIDKDARPDVLIDLGGVKFVIEGRTASQRTSLLKDAQERIEQGVADLSMAVLYPEGLSTAPSQAVLAKNLEKARYSGSLFYYREGTLQETQFENKNLSDLADLLNSSFRLYVQDDAVRTRVASMEETLNDVVKLASSDTLFFTSEALVTRLRNALGIDERGEADAEEE